MANLIRLLAVAAVVLTVVYVSLMAYFRADAREKLTERWHGAGQPETLEGYVKAGLEERLPALRRRLLIWVYAVPLSLIAVLVYTPGE